METNRNAESKMKTVKAVRGEFPAGEKTDPSPKPNIAAAKPRETYNENDYLTEMEIAEKALE